MLVTGIYNIVCPQGATYSETFTYSVGGVAVNLTGYSAKMQIRRSYDDANPLSTLTSSSGGIVLGGSAGTIALSIAYATTETFEAGQYIYDLEIVSGGGIKDRILQGTFTVSAEITRV
jgi:hypothetical protein